MQQLVALNKNIKVYLLVSMDSKFTEQEANTSKHFKRLEDLFNKNLPVPIFLQHNSSKPKRRNFKDSYIFGVYQLGKITFGLDYYGDIPDKMSQNKQIQVFLVSSKYKSNEFHFFEACEMWKHENELKIEIASVLLVNYYENSLESVFEHFQEKRKNLTMMNFKIAEFEVEGADVCNYVEYYLNDCIQNVNTQIKNVHGIVFYFFTTFFLLLLGLYGTRIIMHIAQIIQKRRMITRVQPFIGDKL